MNIIFNIWTINNHYHSSLRPYDEKKKPYKTELAHLKVGLTSKTYPRTLILV